jgi:hypothetical protein
MYGRRRADRLGWLVADWLVMHSTCLVAGPAVVGASMT